MFGTVFNFQIFTQSHKCLFIGIQISLTMRGEGPQFVTGSVNDPFKSFGIGFYP